MDFPGFFLEIHILWPLYDGIEIRLKVRYGTMGFSTSTCTEFVEVLASKAPVPGGGGASALVAAVGTALGNMVGSLTVGKKKYADVEDEMWELKAKCDQLQKDFLRLIERDAELL